MTALELALETDLVLSERQVLMRHGLTLGDCHELGLAIQPVLVAPTVHRKATRAVIFVMLEPQVLQPFEFRHLAAVAEVRYQLRVDTQDWQVVRHGAQTSPDAIWHRKREAWAVEFDAGTYSRSTVFEKAQAFRAGFDGQVWAVSSDHRATTVHAVTLIPVVVITPF